MCCGRTHATGETLTQPLSLDACREDLKISAMDPKKSAAEARRLRLAKALKANLGKRKAKLKIPPPARKPAGD